MRTIGKTYKTKATERSTLEQNFRDLAAEYFKKYRTESKKNKYLASHWEGKFAAFCHAAEKVALEQSVAKTIKAAIGSGNLEFKN